MWTLSGRRLDDDILESPIPSPMGKAHARNPRAQDNLDRFFKAAFRLFRRHTETLEFAVPVAFADAEIQPTVGNQIKRRRLLRQEDRVVPRQDHYRRTKPQCGGSHGETSKQRERGRNLIPTGEMMLD